MWNSFICVLSIADHEVPNSTHSKHVQEAVNVQKTMHQIVIVVYISWESVLSQLPNQNPYIWTEPPPHSLP